ncbi:LuxR C-terminal-related transcriptional regulator [Nocardioides sp. S-58]|uniref:LuxR C-terminal-related transcriptional regulator n=1 Tax=Nocardioides renjunii TaxID=3095075 RepID=A0ABU5KB25_9ACTN|nr:LuxR C-terminal-related transcriptional regulator [Nocardioides sp. S-58]MDZ5662163.1 LuxR C-terminal-related transcriptional regulator [Nocardioides sp. S-58]
MSERPEHVVLLEPAPRSVDQFLEAKLHRPPARDGWVGRPRLLDVLDRSVSRSVTLVAAPAGYGKTTVVAQWLASRRGERAAAWVSIDAGDNDPARLWAHIATALQRAGCFLAPDLPMFLVAASADVRTRLLPHLLNALAATSDGITLVLDDFHVLVSPECHEQVGFLVENLPPSTSLVITSRSDPGLRLGRLRASGGLAELRADDLAFTRDEARELAAREGVDLPDVELDELVDDTEGWPAGLYLSVLLRAHDDSTSTVAPHARTANRFVGTYVTEEVLSQHPPPVRDLILRASILERFCAPLCDAVAGRSGSAGTLAALARENLFLVPLDDTGTWFRFHHLFAAVVRSQLEATLGDDVAEMHRRAAAWFRANGYVDVAVAHLVDAGDHRAAATVIQENWFDYYDVGRSGTVRAWMRALDPRVVATDAAAGVTAAWLATVRGDRPAQAQHMQALEPLADVGPLPDGTHSVESAVALMRASYGYGGPGDMARAARRAVELETDPRTRGYAIAQHSLGHLAYLDGDLDGAMALLTEVRRCEAAPATLRVNGLALEAFIEDERGDHERSREAAELAAAIVDARAMHETPQMSISLTALAQVQASAGALDEAMATCRRGLSIRRRHMTYAPWMTIHHLTVMARVAALSGDTPLALELLDEIDDLVSGYADGVAGVRARLAAIRSLTGAGASSRGGGEQLTAREVDVLRLLQGPLSLREVAGELYLSPNTVKSHTRSAFRKLGARSRAEAVEAARRRRIL